MSVERGLTPRELLEADYEIVRELGTGGTAIVYLARHRVTGEEVAIKVIRSAYLEDEEALARFAREAQFASRIIHPNVVPVRQVLPLGSGGIALVMAHVAGKTLKGLIRETGRLPASRAEQILRDTAAGLSAAHEMDVVHRDVKPENIFIDEHGRALLADFGLARSTNGDSGVTMTGVAIGTPTYMPPEQIDGAAFDARGDVYSLGLVGWEMLTGKRPWDGDSLYALLYHQKHDYLPDVREFREDVPDTLAAVIATAIEKDPAARWQSVEEMVAALDGTVPARSPAPRATASETVRLTRGGPLGAAPVRDVTFRPSEPLPAPTEEDLAPRRGNRLLFPVVAIAAVAALLLAVFGLHKWLTPVDDYAGVVATPPIRFDTSTTAIASAAPAGAADSAAAGRRTDSLASLAATRDSSPPRTLAERGGDVTESRELSPAMQAGRSAAPSRGRTVDAAAPQKSQNNAQKKAREQAQEKTAAVSPTPVPAPAAPPASPPASPAPSVNVRAAAAATIAAGGMHTCLIGTDGRGYCWGANSRGQLGTTSNARTPVPLAVTGNLNITAIAAGLTHSCAIARDGGTWCWGDNDHGQLGDHSTTARSSPVRAAEGHALRVVAAGASHSCGLDRDGAAWCWGGGSHGQLGNGNTKDSNTPVRVATAHLAALTAGWNFNCGLDAAGRAYCWGENDAGQLGVRDTLDRSEPTLVAADVPFVAIAAGAAHACGVTASGSAYCWGKNSSGQLGDGTTVSRTIPTLVKASEHFVAITAGAAHSCAIDNEGHAYCWGFNAYGQLGDGATARQVQPTPVAGGHAFSALAAFGSHTCGTTPARDVFCWGYNLEGQLGDGTRTNRARPTYIEPLDNR